MPIAYPQTGIRFVEFIAPGIYTFFVPPYVTGALIDGCAGGGGGAAGFASATQASGGGGGGSSANWTGYPITLIPQSTLTITVGAAGVGGIVGGALATAGGITTIVGALLAGTIFTFQLNGGAPGNYPVSNTVGGVAGQGGPSGQGGPGVTASMLTPWYIGGSGGGAGGTNAAGGLNGAGLGPLSNTGGAGGPGNGGGGGGAGGVFGAGGRGGNGGAVPSLGATPFGSGGGGGGGGWNTNGGIGTSGYLRLRF